MGFSEGGIPIGAVLVHEGRVLGRGHNRRVQKGSVILHGEMDALENAGRRPTHVYRECANSRGVTVEVLDTMRGAGT